MFKINILKTIKISFIALMLFFGPTACFFVEKCPPSLPYFTINGLLLDNLEYTGPQNVHPWPKIEGNKAVKWNNFFMQVKFERSFYAKTKNGGGANLYALSCIGDGEFGSKVGVDTVYVIALKDYNGKYLKNDTLNDIVLVNYRTISAEDFTNFFSLAQYVKENEKNIKNDVLELKLTEQPAIDNGDYQFKVVFHLKDGKTFEKNSPLVKLSK